MNVERIYPERNEDPNGLGNEFDEAVSANLMDAHDHEESGDAHDEAYSEEVIENDFARAHNEQEEQNLDMSSEQTEEAEEALFESNDQAIETDDDLVSGVSEVVRQTSDRNDQGIVMEKPMKRKSSNGAAAPIIVGGVGVVLSVVAIGLASLSMMGNSSVEMKVAENAQAAMDNSTAIESLSDLNKALSTRVTDATNQIQANSSQLRSVSAIQNRVGEIQSEVASIRAEMSPMQQQINTNATAIETQAEQFTKFNELVADLSKKTESISLAQRKLKLKPKAQVKRTPTDRIEDASIASVDYWGSEPYAVLKDKKGEWVPLAMGEFYKGWKFVDVKDNVAMFKKGTKTRRLKVEG